MHILLINYEFPPLGGGAGNASFFIARELVRSGHDITVLTSGFKGLPSAEFKDGIQVIRVPVRRKHVDRCSIFEMCTFILSAILHSGAVIRQAQPQHNLVFFGIPGGPVGLWFKMRYGIPYVLSLRGGDVPGTQPAQLAAYHTMTAPFSRLVWRGAQKVVANGKRLQNLARQFDNTIEIASIRNGVDTSFFMPKYKRQDSTLSLLYVGRFSEEKGLCYLLEALALLKSSRPDARFKLTLIGDGPMRPSIKQQISTLKLNNHITLGTWTARQNLPAIYNQADIFILPSPEEGFPNVILEAMASGLPVIASTTLTNEGLILDEVNGLLVQPCNPNAITTAIITFLDNPAKIKEMGHAARTYVEQCFSWQTSAAGYQELLEISTVRPEKPVEMNRKHFDFGRNWQDFSHSRLDPMKADAASKDFLELMHGIQLKNASFLDIGFGQGLSLLSATEAGARTMGLDINPLCAKVLDENRRYFPSLSATPIPIAVGSILDQTTLSHLRTMSPDTGQYYDIVHAWGVLHHTGNMIKALANAGSLVKPGGFLVIAIYNRHWSSPAWHLIKRLYCISPALIRKLMVYSFIPIIWIAKFLVTGKLPSHKSRGMDFFYDIIDWIGGYPYEYATVDEIRFMVEQLGFDCIRIIAAKVPTGCNEFIFQKKVGITS